MNCPWNLDNGSECTGKGFCTVDCSGLRRSTKLAVLRNELRGCSSDYSANLIAISLTLVKLTSFRFENVDTMPWLVMRGANAALSITLQMAAALFVCALSGAFASQAQASCGDYLMGHYEQQLSDRSVPLPCHGPQCQKAPSRPLMPVPPLQTQPPDRDVAIVHTAGLSLQAAVCFHWVIETHSGPQHLAPPAVPATT